MPPVGNTVLITYEVETGSLKWRGLATSDADAFSQAIASAPAGTQLGELVTFWEDKKGERAVRYGLTENYMKGNHYE